MEVTLNFQDAEKTYKDLKAQHAAGKLSDADFETEVAKLRLQDAQGRWWQLGVQTGDWYMHDGQKWNKAKPPATVAPPPPKEPSAAPEGATPVTPPPSSRRGGTGGGGGSALPARLFSAAPAGRGNGKGIPTWMLIAIIAVVAIVGIAILVGGYLFISGALGRSTAQVTTTPTRSLALLPSPVIPTITLAAPTDTPLPPPTIEVTTTAAITPVNTPAPARPTATRRPAASPTPAGPTATHTPSVPPGVYVTKLETDPIVANIGDTVAFKLTFFNNTGAVQTYHDWFVRVFQDPEQTTGDGAFKNSYGESLKQDVNIATGTSVATTPPHVNFGPGRCNYVAIPYYTDKNSQAVQFQKPGGGALYYSFSVCH